MTIKIKINKEKEPQAQISLDIKKTVDGNILVSNHEYIDILIDPEKKKIVTVPKFDIERDTYEYQRELMNYLFRKGLLPPDEAQSGSRFGVIEATFSGSDDVNSLQALLFQIEKYIHASNNSDIKAKEYDENIEDNFVDPPESETTALGEIPPYQDNPEAQQSNSQYTFAGYGYLY